MKRAIPRSGAVAAGVVISALLLSACTSTEGTTEEPVASDKLVIASWGGAFSEATRQAFAEPFSAETGIEVVVLDTGNHVATIQGMEAAGNIEWDIVDSMTWPDAIFLHNAGLLATWPDDLQADLVATYGTDAVTDYGHSNSGYGAVLVCNRETVEVCPQTIEEFFDVDAFPGKRMLPGDAAFFHVLAAILAMAEGGDSTDLYGDVTADDLIARLGEIAPSIDVWWTAGDQSNQAILQGEADMGIMLSGRAYMVLDEGVDLDISWDGVYVTGAMTILEGAPHSDAAVRYIEWMRQNPEAQAQWAELLNYATPHPDIYEYLAQDRASRLATFPDNLANLSTQDFDWFEDNKAELDAGFIGVLQG